MELAEPPPPQQPAPAPPFITGAALAVGPAVRATRGASTDIGGYLGADLLLRHALFVRAEAFTFSSHRGLVIVPDALLGGRKLGSLLTRSTTASIGPGVCVGSIVIGCAELHAGATLLAVAPRGPDLHDKTSRSLWRAALGGGGSLGYHLPWQLQAQVALSGMAVIAPARLRVEGMTEPAFSQPAIEWLVSVGLRRTFF